MCRHNFAVYSSIVSFLDDDYLKPSNISSVSSPELPAALCIVAAHGDDMIAPRVVDVSEYWFPSRLMLNNDRLAADNACGV